MTPVVATMEGFLVRRIASRFDASLNATMEWWETKIKKLASSHYKFDLELLHTSASPHDNGGILEGKHRYCYVVKIRITPDKHDVARMSNLMDHIHKLGNDKRWNKYPWEFYPDKHDDDVLDIVNGEGNAIPLDPDAASPGFQFKEISVEREKHFKHLFGLDEQINMVCSAIEAAKATDFTRRFHTVLHGPPGCGKTQTLLAVCQMVAGKHSGEGEAYVKLDAPSTTQAGAEQLFLKAPTIPAVVVVEEIEKVPEVALRWLLSVLDARGEVRKTNARIGSVARRVHSVVLATVNDKKLFDSVLSGALSSRFPNEVHYPRPSKAIQRQILKRELASMKGDPRWIDPVLDYCAENFIDDPRKAIMILTMGREKLLDGSYQASMQATMSEAQRELIREKRAALSSSGGKPEGLDQLAERMMALREKRAMAS